MQTQGCPSAGLSGADRRWVAPTACRQPLEPPCGRQCAEGWSLATAGCGSAGGSSHGLHYRSAMHSWYGGQVGCAQRRERRHTQNLRLLFGHARSLNWDSFHLPPLHAVGLNRGGTRARPWSSRAPWEANRAGRRVARPGCAPHRLPGRQQRPRERPVAATHFPRLDRPLGPLQGLPAAPRDCWDTGSNTRCGCRTRGPVGEAPDLLMDSAAQALQGQPSSQVSR